MTDKNRKKDYKEKIYLILNDVNSELIYLSVYKINITTATGFCLKNQVAAVRNLFCRKVF